MSGLSNPCPPVPGPRRLELTVSSLVMRDWHGGSRATTQVARLEPPPRPYTFYVNTAFFWKGADSDKPHIGATVVDSMEPGQSDVLRSEVAAAVGLLQQQVRRGDFRRHHTLPVGDTVQNLFTCHANAVPVSSLLGHCVFFSPRPFWPDHPVSC